MISRRKPEESNVLKALGLLHYSDSDSDAEEVKQRSPHISKKSYQGETSSRGQEETEIITIKGNPIIVPQRNNGIKLLGFVSMFVFLLACADTKYTLSETAIKIVNKGEPIFNKELTNKQCVDLIQALSRNLKKLEKYKLTESLDIEDNSILHDRALEQQHWINTDGGLTITLPDNDSHKIVLKPNEVTELLHNDPEVIALHLMMEFNEACKNPIYIQWGEVELTFEQMVIYVSENEELSQEFVRNVLILWEYFIGIKIKLVGLINQPSFDLETVNELLKSGLEGIDKTCRTMLSTIHSTYHQTFSIMLHKVVMFIFSDIRATAGAYVFLFLVCPLLGQYFISYIYRSIVLILRRKNEEHQEFTNEQIESLLVKIQKKHLSIKDGKSGGGKYTLDDEIVNSIVNKLAFSSCAYIERKYIFDFLKYLPEDIISRATDTATYFVSASASNFPLVSTKGGSKKTKTKRRRTKNNKTKRRKTKNNKAKKD